MNLRLQKFIIKKNKDNTFIVKYNFDVKYNFHRRMFHEFSLLISKVK